MKILEKIFKYNSLDPKKSGIGKATGKEKLTVKFHRWGVIKE